MGGNHVSRERVWNATTAAQRAMVGGSKRVVHSVLDRLSREPRLESILATTTPPILVWLGSGHEPLRRWLLSRRLVGWWVTVVLGALVATRDLARAQEVLDAAAPVWSERSDAMWRLRELQIRCATGGTPLAAALVESWGGFSVLPEVASATGAGLLAELGRWDEVIAFFSDRLRQGMTIRGTLFEDTLAGATRMTGRYEFVVGLLTASGQPQLAALEVGLRTEAALLEMLGLREGVGALR